MGEGWAVQGLKDDEESVRLQSRSAPSFWLGLGAVPFSSSPASPIAVLGGERKREATLLGEHRHTE